MTQTHVNGFFPMMNGVNGHHGVNGFVDPPQPAPLRPAYILDSDVYPDYLDGYTIEEVRNARPISDQYLLASIPPGVKPPPMDLSSFKSGHVPTTQELKAGLQMTFDGQLPLSHFLGRLVQDAYVNLNELGEMCVTVRFLLTAANVPAMIPIYLRLGQYICF